MVSAVFNASVGWASFSMSTHFSACVLAVANSRLKPLLRFGAGGYEFLQDGVATR